MLDKPIFLNLPYLNIYTESKVFKITYVYNSSRSLLSHDIELITSDSDPGERNCVLIKD